LSELTELEVTHNPLEQFGFEVLMAEIMKRITNKNIRFANLLQLYYIYFYTSQGSSVGIVTEYEPTVGV
jgi:hypothetical protein